MIKTYLKLIGFGIALTLFISLFSAIGVIFKVNEISSLYLQIVAFALAALITGFYMLKKDRTLAVFGFIKGKYSFSLILFIAIIIFVQPIIMGVNTSLTPLTIGLIIIQMILVGFVEESLFRAIFFYQLANNKIGFLIFSSTVFGILHGAIGINPESPLILVALQMINALLLGVVFGLLYLKTQSIYITIIFHALFNILASISLTNNLNNEIFSVCVLVIIYLLFILYLSKTTKS